MLRRNDAAAARLNVSQSFRESRQRDREEGDGGSSRARSRSHPAHDAGDGEEVRALDSPVADGWGISLGEGEGDGGVSRVMSEGGASGDSEGSNGVYVPRDTRTLLAAST
jgi:hypothetical protein